MGIAAASIAARSVFRSSSVRNVATKIASEAKSARSSPFRLPSRTPLLAHRIFREPRRTECVLGFDAAVPHSYRLRIDDIDADSLSLRFCLAPRSVSSDVEP
ncbi:hypothetical protein CASFOL_008084 [Castilleja foliolosa]|uniref:Uncharacterized protein n=1 Tax=Castilleja foliolosa TaxID=1961234 RepID=A0ABD3DZ88_9LAMI